MEETEYVNEMERLRVAPKKQAAKLQVPKGRETTMAEAEIMAALNGEMKIETSTTETTATTERTAAMTDAEIMAALALMSESDTDSDDDATNYDEEELTPHAPAATCTKKILTPPSAVVAADSSDMNFS